MDMNQWIEQCLLEQNRSCHETSECRICSSEVPIDGTVRVNLEQLSTLPSLGWILQYDDATRTAVVSEQMGHQLLIGSTGTGKTQCMILNTVDCFSRFSDAVKPNLFMTDPKGEILKRTGECLRSRGYRLVVIDTRHPESSARYNPMFGIFDDYQQSLKLQKILAEDDQMKEKKSSCHPTTDRAPTGTCGACRCGIVQYYDSDHGVSRIIVAYGSQKHDACDPIYDAL